MTIQRLIKIGLLFFCALPAAAQDVSGRWNASIETPQGALPLIIELAADGRTLTGTFSNHFMPKIPLQDGVIARDKLTFTLMLASVTPRLRGHARRRHAHAQPQGGRAARYERWAIVGRRAHVGRCPHGDACALSKELRKLGMKIKTSSRARYAEGIGWGDVKQLLFERIKREVAPARAEYERLLANPGEVEQAPRSGAEKARAFSGPFLAEIRDKVGIRPPAR